MFLSSRIHNAEKDTYISTAFVIQKVLENVEESQKELNSMQFPLVTRITPKSRADLASDREYMVPNARRNYKGIETCWHIYPNRSNEMVVVEHPVSFDVYDGIWFISPRRFDS